MNVHPVTAEYDKSANRNDHSRIDVELVDVEDTRDESKQEKDEQ